MCTAIGTRMNIGVGWVCGVVGVCTGECVHWWVCALVSVWSGGCVQWCVCALVSVCTGECVHWWRYSFQAGTLV